MTKEGLIAPSRAAARTTFGGRQREAEKEWRGMPLLTIRYCIAERTLPFLNSVFAPAGRTKLECISRPSTIRSYVTNYTLRAARAHSGLPALRSIRALSHSCFRVAGSG